MTQAAKILFSHHWRWSAAWCLFFLVPAKEVVLSADESQKDRRKFRSKDLESRSRPWREKPVSHSAEETKQPRARVILPPNKEPTFYIGGGNGVNM